MVLPNSIFLQSTTSDYQRAATISSAPTSSFQPSSPSPVVSSPPDFSLDHASTSQQRTSPVPTPAEKSSRTSKPPSYL